MKFVLAVRGVAAALLVLCVVAHGGSVTSAQGGAPSVTSSSPAQSSTNISRSVFVSADVFIPNGGIDSASLTAATVYLERVDGVRVPGVLNTSAFGDVIVLRPETMLDADTTYTFTVTNALRDITGAGFVPFTSTFTTGTSTAPVDTSVAFERLNIPPAVAPLDNYTSVTIGPDGKLYAGTLNGTIYRFTINPDGTLDAPQLIESIVQANGGDRFLLGLEFDPAATANNLVLYASHSTPFSNPLDWSGKISRLSGPDLVTVTDLVFNLPRAAGDHATNQLRFGPDGALYISQGSNTGMGASDPAFQNREERLLSAAILRLDVAAITSPLDAKTAEGGTYDPFAPNAPLTIYATGVRNSFDLLWHRNGHLYVPGNGSGLGSTPATPDLSQPCAPRIDGDVNGPYLGPPVPALDLPGPTNDFLFDVVQGGYYGHTNPTRCEFVLNGGNPTSAVDSAEVSAYPVGTQPDRNYRGFAFDFGRHYSPNGIIEYKSSAFGGALTGKLLVVRYSGGDDIIALTPGSNGGIAGPQSTFAGLSGFSDPLDIIEDVATGNLYVAELGAQRLVLLRPMTPPAAPSFLTAVAASGSRINLTWVDESDNEQGFTIERSTDGTNFTEVGTVGANLRTFSNSSLSPLTTYTYQVRSYNGAGASMPTPSAVTTTTGVAEPPPAATFLGTDATTLGTWQGVYGTEGFLVVNDTMSLPASVQLAPSGHADFTWAASTADVRGLQKGSTAGRVAATWFVPSGPPGMALDLDLVDGQPHRLALYLVDWDLRGRVQRVQVTEAATGVVLDSRDVSGFSGGQYWVWELNGHVRLTITGLSGPNAVVSGVFLDLSEGAPAVVATPTISPAGGTFATAQLVTLSTPTAGATIRYTTDGMPVTSGSPVYGGPFSVGTTSTVRAQAVAAGLTDSAVATATFTITPATVATPVISPAGGTFATAQLVTLSTPTAGATIRYTTDGTPVTSGSPVYGGPFSVGTTSTVRAQAVAAGMADSAVATATFTITPTGGGGGASATFVGVDATTQGSWRGVYGSEGAGVIGDVLSYPSYAVVTPAGQGTWTWAGTTGEARALQRTTGPERLAATWHSTGAGVYTIEMNLTDGQAHRVTVYALDWDSPSRSQRLEVLAVGSGAVLDSRELSGFNGGRYVTWQVQGHVRLRVTRLGGANAVLSGLFFDAAAGAPGTVATPVISPAGGTFATAQLVTLSTPTAGATIRYTTDGMPVTSGSPVYGGPFSVGTTSTVRAQAVAAGLTDSAVATATFTITPATVATPVISPAGGTFATAQLVTLSTTTAGATIRYTTDGAPVTSGSPVYGGPFSVGTSGTVQAQAVAAGMADSAVATATFTITPGGGGGASATFVGVDATTQGNWRGVYGSEGAGVIGDVLSYPSYAVVTPAGQGTWTWAGTTGEARALQRTTGPERLAATWHSTGAGVYTIEMNLTDGQAHRVTVYALDWDSPSRSQRLEVLAVGSGAVLDSRELSGFNGGRYVTWQVQGHVRLRVTRLGGANAVLSGLFFDAAAGAPGTVATPVISPAGGTFATAQLVTLSTPTAGATIRYTTDGMPVTSGSPVYGGPFSVGTTSTVRAQAVAAGLTDSAVATATFTITPATVATPVISPAGGTFATAQLVTLSTPTAGATIRYTTDGAPVTSGSPVYGGPFSVGTSGTVQAQAVAAGMADSAVATATFTITPTGGGGGASATFVGVDATTQGSWRGVYGSEGAGVIGDVLSYPSYAVVTPAGQGTWTWAGTTGEARALQRTTGPERLAATWHSTGAGVYTIEMNLTDGQAHRVTVYALDWDSPSRSQRLEVLAVGSGAVLDSRELSGFNGGRYVTWQVQGHVRLRVTRLGGANAVLSGLFFDAAAGAPGTVATPVISPAGGTFATAQLVTLSTPTAGATIRYTTDGMPVTSGSPVYGGPFSVGTTSTVRAQAVAAGLTDSAVATATFTITPAGGGTSADFVRTDTITQGSWRGAYGNDGHFMAGEGALSPPYGGVSLTGHSTWTWASSTSEGRGLQKDQAPGRIAAAWHTTGAPFDIDINLTDGQAHQVALYALDWDSTIRNQRVEVLDAVSGALLDTRDLAGFNGGRYLVWRIRGHVRFRVTLLGPGPNAVVSGLFFDHVIATTSPTVAITGPASGTVVPGLPLEIEATASDTDDLVSRVEFYANSVLIGTDTFAPYRVTWTDATPGDYALTARVVDNAGAATLSQPVFVGIGVPKVMALGDSITNGEGGYRVELWNSLVASGRPVNFVGSLVSGPGVLPDRDHEGHNGANIGNISSAIDGWLGAYTPNAILLQIGTNDMLQNLDLANAPTRLSALIDRITTMLPHATLFVASITRLTHLPFNERVVQYNAAIPGIVDAKRAAGANVQFVDMYPTVSDAQLPDGIHPNSSGYVSMAAVWHAALMDIYFAN